MWEKSAVLVCGLRCVVCECGQRGCIGVWVACVVCECGQRGCIGVGVVLCSA